MICPNCGNNVDGGNFCPACGTQFNNQQPAQQPMQDQSMGQPMQGQPMQGQPMPQPMQGQPINPGQPIMAQQAPNKKNLYIGLVLGIVGLIIAGIPLGAAAIGLGVSYKENSGLKIATIVLGAFDVIGAILVIAGVIG
jgi:hypothetical protein